MIQTVVDRAAAKGFQGSILKTAMKRAVQNIVLDTITTRINDAPAFTAPVVIFLSNKVQKCSLEHAKIKKRYKAMIRTVNETEPQPLTDSSS